MVSVNYDLGLDLGPSALYQERELRSQGEMGARWAILPCYSLRAARTWLIATRVKSWSIQQF
jgi:hypothetical protein